MTATRYQTKRCAGCPRKIRVAVRGGNRYCVECKEAVALERLAERALRRRLSFGEQDRSRAAANAVEDAAPTIMQRLHLIDSWMRDP